MPLYRRSSVLAPSGIAPLYEAIDTSISSIPEALCKILLGKAWLESHASSGHLGLQAIHRHKRKRGEEA